MTTRPGPWTPAEVRSKRYWLPGVHRLQITFDGGVNHLTLYVLHMFGFALALHLPRRVTERLLAIEDGDAS
jgi:hypothetical protein